MENIESVIGGSEKLTRIYGGWPSFHDAEILELQHWRGRMKPGSHWDEGNVMPVLTAKIHIFIEGPASQHTLATLRFEDVDNYRMEGFNHQNVISGLSITVQERGENLTPSLMVEFQPVFGLGASFRCFRIEVVEAVPCTEGGEVNV